MNDDTKSNLRPAVTRSGGPLPVPDGRAARKDLRLRVARHADELLRSLDEVAAATKALRAEPNNETKQNRARQAVQFHRNSRRRLERSLFKQAEQIAKERRS